MTKKSIYCHKEMVLLTKNSFVKLPLHFSATTTRQQVRGSGKSCLQVPDNVVVGLRIGCKQTVLLFSIIRALLPQVLEPFRMERHQHDSQHPSQPETDNKKLKNTN